MKLEWSRQGQDEHILSAPIVVNGVLPGYSKRLRRVRRASHGGWYVQRKTHCGWKAVEPRITYDTMQYAIGAAVGSVTPGELA